MPHEEVRIKQKRYDNSSYFDVYEHTEFYCPNCGKQGIWLQGDDDYYLGQSGICVQCGKYHHNSGDFYSVDVKVLEVLRCHSENKTS